jgi:hypothetical protein
VITAIIKPNSNIRNNNFSLEYPKKKALFSSFGASNNSRKASKAWNNNKIK